MIGAPEESLRPEVKILELERAKLFHRGLKDLRARTIYGSILWQLSQDYELLNQWQDALAAQNSLSDLKLPRDAIGNCNDCSARGDDKILAIDLERLLSKVWAVETVEHIRFDHDRRLPVPLLGTKNVRSRTHESWNESCPD